MKRSGTPLSFVRLLFSVWGVITMALTCDSSQVASLFPFVLPWDDDSPGITDISHLSDKPAGKEGFVGVGRDGHLYSGGKRIRFLGVNLCFGACFPRKEDSEKIARRIAKYGINIVRFHHMDMGTFPVGIRDPRTKDTRRLHPEALDRLDYLIYQLKRNGIYTNLNLLVSRPFNAADGLPPEIESLDWKERHIVGFFYEPVIELQKEYARNLLTHRNPYTNTTYAEEPAVAFVEINNENGLIHSWLGYQVDRLPSVFLKELQRQWNQWLRRRYATTEAVKRAWQVKEEPPGDELLINGGFTDGLKNWVLEQHEGAKAEASVERFPEGPDGPTVALKVRVLQKGRQGWHIQLNQPGLTVEPGVPYTLTFWARSERDRTISVGIKEAHSPWNDLGFRTNVPVTKLWSRFEFSFLLAQGDSNARVDVSGLGEAEGTFWFAGFSFKKGGTVGLNPDEKIEAGSVEIVLRGQQGRRTIHAQKDWITFLWQTEERYWRTIADFIKGELNYRGLVIGTIVGCSTPNLMAKLDAVDTHAYWQHPIFPSRPWDADDWIVPNRTMVSVRGGTIPSLALRRVLGKPHSVTEYNHPAPNTYSSEGFLLLAAYASLQDWDAIYAFSYSHRTDDWDLRRIPNFFDIDQHPTKMVTLIPAAVMFRRGDVQPAKKLICVPLPKDAEQQILLTANPWDLVHAGHLKVPGPLALVHRIAMATEGIPVPKGAERPGAQQVDGPIVSDTGELMWDLSDPTGGVVTINSERSKAVIGFAGGRIFKLGWLQIEGVRSLQDDWVAVTVTEMEAGRSPGRDRSRVRRLLITATGYAENTNMVWKTPDRSSVGRQWGDPPSLVEGIGAQIKVAFSARTAKAWALDERGQRRKEVPVTVGNGVVSLRLGPEWRTLWYELEIE